MELEKSQKEKIKEFSQQLKKQLEKKFNSLIFITGAGVSAESGIPTYRGSGGIYNDGLVEEGFTIEEILSKSVFKNKPSLTWKYIRKLEKTLRDKKPNLAHSMIKNFENYFNVTVLTQNIDSFHQKANSTNIIPIHGSLNKIICSECNYQKNYLDYQNLPESFHCPQCEKILRPDIILYEESIKEKNINQLNEILRKKSLAGIIVVGTSSVFPYIIAPVEYMRVQGKLTLEINPQTTYLTKLVDTSVQGKAGLSLALLYSYLGK